MRLCLSPPKTRGEVNDRLVEVGHETLSVFLPTTPNPTSGFLLFVPKKDVTISDMYDGTRTVLTVLTSERRMPCLIHHVA